MSPADVIAQLLVDENHGTFEGAWRIFVGFMQQDPNNALCVYDTQGKLDGRMMRTGEQVTHPGVQVVVRGADYVVTYQKAKDIATGLDAQRKTVVAPDSESSYVLHNVSRTGDIMHLGVELEGDRRRHLFTINAVLTLETIQ